MILDLETRRAPFRPASIDEAARTIELVASTGAGVVREDLEGRYLEVLTVTPPAVDLSRLEGMPLFDSHRQDDLARVLGAVRGARIEDGQLIVLAEISQRHEGIWTDIKRGIIRAVSVGYSVSTFEDRVDRGNRSKGARGHRMDAPRNQPRPRRTDAGAQTRNRDMPTPRPRP